MSFSKKAGQGSENSAQDNGKTKVEFIRSKQDNEMLVPLQIKDNFFNIVDKDAVLWGDFDGIPFKCASSVEDDFILVSLKSPEKDVEGKLTLTDSKEFKNRTEFKGRTRGDKIGSGSFLYDLNLSREVAGLTPFTLSDFEIEDGKRLKYEDGVTIDDIKFEDSLSVCKYFIDKWIEACLLQTRLKKVRPVIGSGETHRHSVLVPHQYKSNRSESRPLLLSEARQHIIDQYNTVIAPPLLEADEVVDAVAARAYDHARKTGTKIKVVKGANDKDARSKRGVLFDWAKSFHFNNPQCWLVKDFDEDVGLIEMHKGSVKGAGAVFFAYQLLMIDEADEYSPRKYLPKDFEHFGKGYGDEAFYKDFAPLKTSQQVFQKVVDKYYEWFPKGLQYTAWDGTAVNEDTLSYLQKHYKLAYMLEGKDDVSTVMTLLDKFGVDYKKLVDNHLPDKPKPLATESVIRDVYNQVCKDLNEIHEVLKQDKGTKPILVDNMKKADKMLEDVWVTLGNGLFVEQDTVPDNKPRKSLQEIISAYNKEYGYDDSPENDYEVFIECLSKEVVQEETTSEHRWYDVREVVHKVIIDGEDRYFATFDYHITGDNCASDMDLDLPTLGDVYEVFPKKKEVTVYEC